MLIGFIVSFAAAVLAVTFRDADVGLAFQFGGLFALILMFIFTPRSGGA